MTFIPRGRKKFPGKLTADKLAARWERIQGRRYRVVVPNTYPTPNHPEMDLMAIRKSGYIDEIEIKLSVADFRNDFNKTVLVLNNNRYQRITKHCLLKEGKLLANYFYYLMPKKLYEKVKDEIPDYAGVYCHDGLPMLLREAKLLHKNKVTESIIMHSLISVSFRYWRLRNKQAGINEN